MPAPITRSPGHINLSYVVANVPHLISARLNLGINPRNVAAMQSVADSFSGALAFVLTSTSRIIGWTSSDNAGHQLVGGTYSPGVPGTGEHPDPEWRSSSIIITGVGSGSDGSYRNGKTRMTVFTTGPGIPVPGMMSFDSHTWAAVSEFVYTINSSNDYWFDFYGVKAVAHSLVHTQFNSAIQKRFGA